MDAMSLNNKHISPDPSGQLSIPFTVSILISQSIIVSRWSPASTLIIPFFRTNIPYAYFLIFVMELTTALFVKWSSIPANGAGLLRGNFNQAVPDINALRQIYHLPPVQSSLKKNRSNGASGQQNPDDTPLFPKGMTINLSFSAPFSDPNSKASTLLTFELLEIRKLYGVFVAILTLILYALLYPTQK